MSACIIPAASQGEVERGLELSSLPFSFCVATVVVDIDEYPTIVPGSPFPCALDSEESFYVLKGLFHVANKVRASSGQLPFISPQTLGKSRQRPSPCI